MAEQPGRGGWAVRLDRAEKELTNAVL